MQEGEEAGLYDQTIEIVRTALPRMSEHRIPITPSNYAVWFEYFAEGNQALHQEMEKLLASGAPITESQMRDLYERYLNEKGEQLQVAKDALAQLILTLLEQITTADGHYGRFSSTLSDIADEISSETSAASLNSLIERALQATATAMEQGAALKEQLALLAGEMEELRDTLKRTQEEARIDPLTGLSNRLVFGEQVEALSHEGLGDAHTPCLLMIDVDHFKRLNDTYGHVAGDEILKQIGQEIGRNVRGKDLVARYGGEEFAVLLSDTPRSGCQTVAENIRAGIESFRIQLPETLAKPELLTATISAGGAWFRVAESVERFVNRADRALYLSKKGGRNRVTWEGKATEDEKS